MNREIVINITGKLIKYVIIAKLASSCIKLAKSIKRMTPKFETFPEVDADVLVEQLSKRYEDIDISQPENLPVLP